MKKIYSISILLSILILGSCKKDFLDIKPQQSVFPEDVFVDAIV